MEILVLYYSQTGKVKEGLVTFLGPLLEHGHKIDLVPLIPKEPFPFPWGFFPFFGEMPETVLGMPRPIQEPQIDSNKKYDLIVLGFPVWFLRPAQPMQAFLQSKAAQILQNRHVLIFMSCRELWHEAFRSVSGSVRRLKGRIIGRFRTKEATSSLASYIVTPVFLITGRKMIHRSKAAERNNAQLRLLGEEFYKSLEKGEYKVSWEMPPNRNALMTEIVGSESFRIWARIIRGVSPPGTLRRHLAICPFFLYLLLVIPVMKLSEKGWQFVLKVLAPVKLRQYQQSLGE